MSNMDVAMFRPKPIKKILLLGKKGSGKKAIRSTIFSDCALENAKTLLNCKNSSHGKLLGDLWLNLWDYGGESQLMESYFIAKRQDTFRDVRVMVYIFDGKSTHDEWEENIKRFRNSVLQKDSGDIAIKLRRHPRNESRKIMTLDYSKKTDGILRYDR